MDQVSAGKATRDGARTRRRRMREEARSQHASQSPATDRYQTPAWLERSFVLPLSSPEASDVPNQSVPHHDDYLRVVDRPRMTTHLETDTRLAPAPPAPRAQFVRPPSDDIDFAQVIRHSDLSRKAGRLAWATAGITGVSLIAYLLTTSALALGATVVLAMACAASTMWRARLTHGPVPRLQR